MYVKLVNSNLSRNGRPTSADILFNGKAAGAVILEEGAPIICLRLDPTQEHLRGQAEMLVVQALKQMA